MKHLVILAIAVNMNFIGMSQDQSSIEPVQRDSILIIKLYNSSNFNIYPLKTSLQQHGYTVSEYDHIIPADSLKKVMTSYNQLWLISDYIQHLDSTYLPVFENYLDSGNALYILADNEPYDADAEFLSKNLTGVEFEGNYIADKAGAPAMDADAALMANVSDVYEGFTVSSITIPEAVKPQYIGSQGQVFIASYNNGKKRILFDGGFTRMFAKWDYKSETYFLNAAVWLGGD